MKVNIVLLIKNRPRLTDQTFNSLFKNTPSDLYNLTVIDDGSNEPVMSMLSYATRVGNFRHHDNVAIIRNVTSKGITGQARNLGVYWAEKYWGRSDWLYLSDNDMYFTPGWLETLIKTFSRAPALRLVGGWNHPYLKPHADSFMHTDQKIGGHDAVTGASQLMRWETWDKYGPLDAHAQGVGQSEDWAFCQKIIKDGGRVGSVYPRVVLNCGVTNSYGKESVGADVMLKELGEAKKTYRDLYWE